MTISKMYGTAVNNFQKGCHDRPLKFSCRPQLGKTGTQQERVNEFQQESNADDQSKDKRLHVKFPVPKCRDSLSSLKFN